MNTLTVEINNPVKNFKPGDRVSGAALWQCESPEEVIEVNLIFYTTGKGTPDSEIVEVLRVDSPSLTGRVEFDWVLPGSPYSFTGKLITLKWAVEVVALSSGDTARTDFDLTPDGREIVLK